MSSKAQEERILNSFKEFGQVMTAVVLQRVLDATGNRPEIIEDGNV
jgi:hypothetical protein